MRRKWHDRNDHSRKARGAAAVVRRHRKPTLGVTAVYRPRWIYVAAFLAMAAFSPAAHAGFEVMVGDQVVLYNGAGSPGGIFHVDVLNRGTASDFDTFCVELTEHINLVTTTYYVDNVGLWTVHGNKKLGAQAAWLYTQFLNVNNSLTTGLAGFDFSLVAGNPSSMTAKRQADALQLGIWRGMVDINNDPDPYEDSDIRSLAGWSQTYINALTSDYLGTWLGNFANDLNWSGTGNIRIMNLRKFKYVDGELVPTTYAQDQLVSVVPELPSFYSACTVMSCALLGAIVAHVRRRRHVAAGD
jgi:hypothetical protein